MTSRYIPPFQLSKVDEYTERTSWVALKKTLNGLVNKVNSTNIKHIIPELFAENLIRGRGLFCRTCIKSQMACPDFTDVFAALVAVVNTKFPEIGLLLSRRLIFIHFMNAFKRNDKPQLLATVKFIAHLANQRVVNELIALEVLTMLLEKPTDDSVEVAVSFVTECGSLLLEVCPRGLHGVFERFRGILYEGDLDRRVRFLIEGLFALRKAKFLGYPAVREELDLVDEEEQITHEVSLMADDDEIDLQSDLDVFNHDPNFAENENRYEQIKKQILLGHEKEEEESNDEELESELELELESEQMEIKDETETNLINLRRSIYLTIMSSVGFEEAGHKLMEIMKGAEQGHEMELCVMLLECCINERSYQSYYGLLAQRFCTLNRFYVQNFEECFVQQYSTLHRMETNQIRNVANLFAHLLATDALPWHHVLGYIRLTEKDTTSSARIFIKLLFLELSEHLGIRSLNERLLSMKDCSIFPKDTPSNTRFAINFFTVIGLGGITQNSRDYLRNMQAISRSGEGESDDDDKCRNRKKRRRN